MREEKRWMLQYFHERTYRFQSLDEFAREAGRAAKLGAEFFFIQDIPKRRADWLEHAGDPYPNWGMLLTSLFKLAVPGALEPFLDTEYAKRNLAVLAERARIVSEYGMKSALVLSDPFYLPEEAYLAHPAWRGPRCEHPRRSREMYFAPCTDEPEVRALYREAMDMLLDEMEIAYLQIITNDSGSGICWSDGLYNGKNGPAACRAVSMADRLAGFLRVFTDSAKAHGQDMLIDLTSDILGFKEEDPILDAARGQLGLGQLINGKDAVGYRPVRQYTFSAYEHIRPMKGLAFPLSLLKMLREAQQTDSRMVKLMIPESAFGEYEAALKAWRHRRSDSLADFLGVWLETAGLVAGSENASVLLEVWMELEKAMARIQDMQLDNFVMMPLVSQRLITRPLVPFPERLSGEERDYYEKYLFQATTQEQAQNYQNIQGMDFMRGFCAVRMVRLIGDQVKMHLQRARSVLGKMTENSLWNREQTAFYRSRLDVFACLVTTLQHAVQYQEILDGTAPGETASLGTVWPIPGDERYRRLNDICRAEVDNTYALYRELSGRTAEYFVLTEEEEDIFLLGAALPEQLLKKARIMLAHMRDTLECYESPNR